MYRFVSFFFVVEKIIPSMGLASYITKFMHINRHIAITYDGIFGRFVTVRAVVLSVKANNALSE